MNQDALRDVYIVIMGAAVTKEGAPSGAMRRRVRGAVRAARSLDGRVLFMPTGGVGRYGPSEAEVMQTLLEESGVAPDRIVLEDQAHDTLSSVENCAAIIDTIDPPPRIMVASDRYHVRRCVLLFRILGTDAHALWIESGRAANGLWRWLYSLVSG